MRRSRMAAERRSGRRSLAAAAGVGGTMTRRDATRHTMGPSREVAVRTPRRLIAPTLPACLCSGNLWFRGATDVIGPARFPPPVVL